MELVVLIYELTAKLPTSEQYGLTSQVRRCAISIPSNIAEGSKRSTRKDFRNFLMISNASTAELETQLLLIERLYPTIETSGVKTKLIEIQKILSVLIKKFDS